MTEPPPAPGALPGTLPGTLYVIATPIGNLEDITFRAVRLLGAVDLIACEDTRHSRKLLEHFHIRVPLVSYYRENEQDRGGEIVARLLAGQSAALISDAGAPLVSDPGALLVAAALAAGVPVVPIPGASAPIAALMACGLEGRDAALPFVFLGFLPARAGDRRRLLEAWRASPASLVFFESPHRLLAALADLEELWGPGRALVVARELTKLHEEFVRGSIAEVHARLLRQPPRGEYTLVAGPPPPEAPPPLDLQQRLAAIADKDELKPLARLTGLSRSELYRRWQQLRRAE